MLKRRHTTSTDAHEQVFNGQDFTAARPAAKRCRSDDPLSRSSDRGVNNLSTNKPSSPKLNVCDPRPSPPSESRRCSNKRTREEAAFETERSSNGLKSKRRQPWNTDEDSGVLPDETDDTAFWVIDKEQQWTEHVKKHTMTGGKQRPGPLKRLASKTESYRQSVSNGSSPYPWTAKHQEEMAEAGVIMSCISEITMAPEDQELCNMILSTKQDCPKEWLYERSTMLKIVVAAELRNEARVVRDTGPYLFPSPEVEHLRGHLELEHIAEALGALWSKCTVWCGPTPKPDATHSISRLAFSAKEREKLLWNNTSACEKGVFPFYICEAKSSDRNVEEAKRQAMHSASVAAKTVIELYDQISAADELDRRVLAFSIAHNQQMAEICAHFPVFDGEQHTFHRKVIHVVDLKNPNADWQAGYCIAFGIWRHFFPRHLERVRSALSRQADRETVPFNARLGLDGNGGSTGLTISTPASTQEDDRSKRPSLSLTAKVQEENAGLREQLTYLMTHVDQQLEEARQREAVLIKQLAEQQEQQKQSAAQQEKIIELLMKK